MNSRALRRIGFVTGALTTSALALAGCAGSSGGAATADPNEKVTLTVATFNEFGYNDLLAEYTKLNPNVKVVEKKAATSDEARENFMTKLAAGSGLSDVEGVEVEGHPKHPGDFVLSA